MKTLVAVPMKDPGDSKSRLATVLDCEQRYQLAVDLFCSTDRFFKLHFPDFDRLVVTASAHISELAESSGAHVLKEPASSGLNAAAEEAILWARGRGYDRFLFVPADIAEWRATEILELLHEGSSSEVVVARAHDAGTNALLIDLRRVHQFEFRFGIDSANRHAMYCAERGISSVVRNWPLLARDIDTVEDLAMAGVFPAAMP